MAAGRSDDLYAPVAAQLGVDRAVAKVAVLGAMYGQTTGHGAQALRRLNAAYPVAMAYLDSADRAGRAGRDLRTYGGRLIRLAATEPRSVSRAAAYGRYARNAMIQGAAAELFKMWAVIVRARCAPLGARIVLCLHDELLVHCPARAGGGGVAAGRRVPAGSRAALGARLRRPLHLRHHDRPQLVGRQERGPGPGELGELAARQARRSSGRACPRAATRRSCPGGWPGSRVSWLLRSSAPIPCGG